MELKYWYLKVKNYTTYTEKRQLTYFKTKAQITLKTYNDMQYLKSGFLIFKMQKNK